jgi:hypothetical protein
MKDVELTGTTRQILVAVSLLSPTAFADVGTARAETSVEITIGAEAARVEAGRLLLFAQPVDPTSGGPVASVDVNQFEYRHNFVAAREVTNLVNGERIRIDGDDPAYPTPLDQLPSGEYWLQAVLDPDHSYAYSGRGGGDIVSEVVRVTLPSRGSATNLTLAKRVPTWGQWEYPDGPMLRPDEVPIVEARIKPFAFDSSVLSKFMGRPIAIEGLILTPGDYETSNERYPVVYFTHGFTAGMTYLADHAVHVMRETQQRRLPPMIWVYLNQSCPTGTHEFADSVNNGPWATALTRELIPDIEHRYRCDNASRGRLLTGHSSGGWAALWLQINYPGLFGGVWATAPDECDFTGFCGVDVTQPEARISYLEMAQIEDVLGPYGGQFSSFEWVFSPRGWDGRPLPLFDRKTGLVDPTVASHWRQHWDISEIVRNRWAELAPNLDGKIRVIVGEKDEANLDDSARRLQAAVKSAGGKATFTFVADKGHFDLYSAGSERMALRRKIAWEMWRVARPNSSLTDPGEPSPSTPAH